MLNRRFLGAPRRPLGALRGPLMGAPRSTNYQNYPRYPTSHPKTGFTCSIQSPPASAPQLDWHVLMGKDNTLSGMVAWNNMKNIANVTGQVAPNRTFTMNGKEVGGRKVTAVITGTIRGDGWLSANIEGPNIKCQGIAVPWAALSPQPRSPDWGKP
jgi:hypothetical protein